MKKENSFDFGLNNTTNNIVVRGKENVLVLGKTGGGMEFAHKLDQIRNATQKITDI